MEPLLRRDSWVKSDKTNVVLVGGGNAVHVLAGLAGSQHLKYRVSLLSLWEGEAERLESAVATSGSITVEGVSTSLTHDITSKQGTPKVFSNDPSEVIPEADVIIFAVPANLHLLYLKAIAPDLRPGTILGALPGQGGFDWCVRDAVGEKMFQQVTLFAAETLPWACRIEELGSRVSILSTKECIDLCVSGPRSDRVVPILSDIIGPLPVLRASKSSFLSVTLSNINSIWHPTITYGQYRDWDLQTPFAEAPLFYEGVDEFTGAKLCSISDEVLSVCRALEARYAGLKLDAVKHVTEWMLESYGPDIEDKSSLARMLQTNKGYKGLRHPMRPRSPGQVGYMPNFFTRYLTEDVPAGLLVTRGVAELAGVPTPHMDEVLRWCQGRVGKQYLTPDGSVARAANLHETRAPQHFGFTSLEDFMARLGYGVHKGAADSESFQASRPQSAPSTGGAAVAATACAGAGA